jgi:hypothetical protein
VSRCPREGLTDGGFGHSSAVEKAVKDQTMDLSAKLVLIEGAVKTEDLGRSLLVLEKALEAYKK